jgi:hypothetical protein
MQAFRAVEKVLSTVFYEEGSTPVLEFSPNFTARRREWSQADVHFPISSNKGNI